MCFDVLEQGVRGKGGNDVIAQHVLLVPGESGEDQTVHTRCDDGGGTTTNTTISLPGGGYRVTWTFVTIPMVVSCHEGIW